MALFQLVLAVLGMATLASAQSENLPLCMNMILDLAQQNIQMLVEVGGYRDPNIEEYRCITTMDKIQTFYRCREGYEAVVISTEDVGDLDLLIDLTEFPGSKKGDNVVICRPSQEVVTAPTATTPAPIPLCSSLTGTNSMEVFEVESWPRVIEVTCQILIPSLGQFRNHTLYVCREGEAIISGPISRRTYACPPLSTAPLATTVTARTTPTTETVTTPSPTAPTTTEQQGEPLCSDLTSHNSIFTFEVASRRRVCPARCRANFGLRTVFICCRGTAQMPPGSSQASCPEQ